MSAGIGCTWEKSFCPGSKFGLCVLHYLGIVGCPGKPILFEQSQCMNGPITGNLAVSETRVCT